MLYDATTNEDDETAAAVLLESPDSIFASAMKAGKDVRASDGIKLILT
jgi:hypothetical protein